MSDTSKTLVIDLDNAGVKELRSAHQQIKRAHKEELQRLLHAVVNEYIRFHDGNHQIALEELCEEFFSKVAPVEYPGGWNGMLQFIMKKSG